MTSISCAWWHQPPTVITPLQALRIAVDCLETNRVVPGEAAVIVARAFRQYLDGQLDITGNLGLRPRQGGAHDVPAKVERRMVRDAAIKHLYDAQPEGCKTAKAQQVADMLKTPPDASQVTEADVFAYLLNLHQQFGQELPKSMRQVLRVVEGKP